MKIRMIIATYDEVASIQKTVAEGLSVPGWRSLRLWMVSPRTGLLPRCWQHERPIDMLN